MRGRKSDALMGYTFKLSPLSAPFDRMFHNVDTRMYQRKQGINPIYNMYAKRLQVLDAINTPQTVPISINPRYPKTMQDNGTAALPNAGVYRKKTYLVGGVISD